MTNQDLVNKTRGPNTHTWSGICQIWEVHATPLPGLVERLHEFAKSDGF